MAHFVIAALLLAADRYLKWYAVSALPPEGVALLPGISFIYFQNPGLIFSLSGPLVATLASVTAYAALCIGALALFKRKDSRLTDTRYQFAAVMIALGGASNMYDRVWHHGVTDYLLFFNRSAVNLADGMILAGIVMGAAALRSQRR